MDDTCIKFALQYRTRSDVMLLEILINSAMKLQSDGVMHLGAIYI